MEVRIWSMLGTAERQVFRTRGWEEIPDGGQALNLVLCAQPGDKEDE